MSCRIDRNSVANGRLGESWLRAGLLWPSKSPTRSLGGCEDRKKPSKNLQGSPRKAQAAASRLRLL